MRNYEHKTKKVAFGLVGMAMMMIIAFTCQSCCVAQIPDQYYYADDSCEFYLPDYSDQVEVSDNCCVDTFLQTPEPGTKLSPAEDIEVVLTGIDCAGNTATLDFMVIVVDTIPPVLHWDSAGIPPVDPPIEPPVDPDFPEDKVSVWFNDFENRGAMDPYTEDVVSADWPWHTHWPEGRSSYMDNQENIAIEDHNGTLVMVNRYPEGQYGIGTEWNNPTDGTGTNIYSVMTESSGWGKMYLSYNVMFKSPFDWANGGKMPGLSAIPMDGSLNNPGPDEGCSVRMMWQPDGEAIMYCYFHRDYDYDYGEGYGLGQIFTTDVWHHITISLQMSDPGVENGIVEVYLDGIKIGSWTGNMTREQADIWINAISWSTFMGGNTPNYAPAFDQEMITDDHEGWFKKDEPKGPGPDDIRAYLRNFPKL